MRILIIEDDIDIARYIEQQLLNNFICKVRIAMEAEEVRGAMSDFLPQLLLCEMRLNEGRDGIKLVKELKRKYVFEVIFITSHYAKATILRAAALRPANYLFKPVNEGLIFATIKLVEPYITTHSKLGQKRTTAPLPHNQLHATELHVLRLILEKKTTREIAEALFLSPYTVKNHRHNICRKLGLTAENNALLKWALKNEKLIDCYHQLPACSSPETED